MKAVFGTIALLIIFFIGSVLFRNYIEESCKILTEQIILMDSYISEEDWDMAEKTIKDLQKIWQQKQKTFVIFLEHYNVDAIEVTIGRIEKFSGLREKTLALGEIVTLRYLIEHVSEREAFSLSNLL